MPLGHLQRCQSNQYDLNCDSLQGNSCKIMVVYHLDIAWLSNLPDSWLMWFMIAGIRLPSARRVFFVSTDLEFLFYADIFNFEWMMPVCGRWKSSKAHTGNESSDNGMNNILEYLKIFLCTSKKEWLTAVNIKDFIQYFLFDNKHASSWGNCVIRNWGIQFKFQNYPNLMSA